MSGAMWFLVVVVVSVVVSGSVGVVLREFLGDSKESRVDGEDRGAGETSRDEKNDGVGGHSATIIFDGGVVSAEYFRGYLDGHRDGSGRNDDALGMVALQRKCRDGYYSR